MQFDGELAFFLAKQTNTYVEFVKKVRIPIFVGSKPIIYEKSLSRNVIERLVIMAGDTIKAEDVKKYL